MALPETELLQGATIDTIELVNPDTECWHYVISTVWGTQLDDLWLGTKQFRAWLITFLDETVVDQHLTQEETT